MRERAIPVIAACGMLLSAACDRPPSSAAPRESAGIPEPRRANAQSPQDLRERQIAFLNRIREADPQQRTIDRALLNEENELGLVLDRSVEMDKIPTLMREMLAQMAREFPGQEPHGYRLYPLESPAKNWNGAAQRANVGYELHS